MIEGEMGIKDRFFVYLKVNVVWSCKEMIFHADK